MATVQYANTATNPFTITGTNQLGPAGGTLSLVTPFVIEPFDSNIGPPQAGYSVMTLTLTVPEPDSPLLLLAATAAVLASAGWRRRR